MGRVEDELGEEDLVASLVDLIASVRLGTMGKSLILCVLTRNRHIVQAI